MNAAPSGVGVGNKTAELTGETGETGGQARRRKHGTREGQRNGGKEERKGAKEQRKGAKEERGSGTVLVLGAGVLLLILFGAVLLLLQSAVAANRAATAADLSALAAADTVRGLREGDPCAVAGEVADRNGAALTGCAVNAGDHTVQVNTEVAAGLVPWPATGRARAGPPP